MMNEPFPISRKPATRFAAMSEQALSTIARLCAWLDRSPLRYWTFHVCVSAVPSFMIGLALVPKPQRFVGMVLGVAFFIALYTYAARWTFPDPTGQALWRRAIRLGILFRTAWAAVILLGSIVNVTKGSNPFCYLFLPDMVSGVLAHSLVERIGSFGDGMMAAVWPTFLITVVAGFLLSGMVFGFAFTCWLGLRWRAWWWNRTTQLTQ
jgi:hypothetical protein